MKKSFNKVNITQNQAGIGITYINREFVSPLIQEVIKFHFKNLADDLGDCLSVTEVLNYSIAKKIVENCKCESQKEFKGNIVDIDELAGRLDNVLEMHVSTMLSDCQNLMNKGDN